MSYAAPAPPIRFVVGDSTIASLIISNSSLSILAEKKPLCGSSMQQEPPPPPPNEGELPEGAAGGESSHKSERKRQRERQRRSALAGAFDELTALLVQIEPDNTASLAGSDPMDSSTSSKRKRRRSVGQEDLEENSSMTRLDLIGRTVGVLRRLQQENADLKRRLIESASDGRDSDQKEVLVMVPTLSPTEHNYWAGPPPDMVRRTSSSGGSSVHQGQQVYPHYSSASYPQHLQPTEAHDYSTAHSGTTSVGGPSSSVPRQQQSPSRSYYGESLYYSEGSWQPPPPTPVDSHHARHPAPHSYHTSLHYHQATMPAQSSHQQHHHQQPHHQQHMQQQHPLSPRTLDKDRKSSYGQQQQQPHRSSSSSEQAPMDRPNNTSNLDQTQQPRDG